MKHLLWATVKKNIDSAPYHNLSSYLRMAIFGMKDIFARIYVGRQGNGFLPEWRWSMITRTLTNFCVWYLWIMVSLIEQLVALALPLCWMNFKETLRAMQECVGTESQTNCGWENTVLHARFNNYNLVE